MIHYRVYINMESTYLRKIWNGDWRLETRDYMRETGCYYYIESRLLMIHPMRQGNLECWVHNLSITFQGYVRKETNFERDHQDPT